MRQDEACNATQCNPDGAGEGYNVQVKAIMCKMPNAKANVKYASHKKRPVFQDRYALPCEGIENDRKWAVYKFGRAAKNIRSPVHPRHESIVWSMKMRGLTVIVRHFCANLKTTRPRSCTHDTSTPKYGFYTTKKVLIQGISRVFIYSILDNSGLTCEY